MLKKTSVEIEFPVLKLKFRYVEIKVPFDEFNWQKV